MIIIVIIVVVVVIVVIIIVGLKQTLKRDGEGSYVSNIVGCNCKP